MAATLEQRPGRLATGRSMTGDEGDAVLIAKLSEQARYLSVQWNAIGALRRAPRLELSGNQKRRRPARARRVVYGVREPLQRVRVLLGRERLHVDGHQEMAGSLGSLRTWSLLDLGLTRAPGRQPARTSIMKARAKPL